ncbi:MULTISPECIES: DMT family transporter [Kitasatospora]|uniref:DMT family transporter n=1 Tax=Kitasatospora cystarginea TaxID=58350 RepID=A0ABP5QGK6_9ACTN
MTASPAPGGALRAATAMAVLGCSTGVTAAFSRYPLFGGQAVRYLLAAVILLPIAARSRSGSLPGHRGPRLSTGELWRLTALAGTGLFGFNVLMVQALRHSDPATVGSVVGCAPLVLAVLAPMLERRRPRLRLVAAAGVVVVGAAITQGFSTGGPVGFLYALGTLGCEAAFSLLAVPLLPRLGPVRVSAYATVLAVPMFALAGLLVDGTALLRRPTEAELAALLYLAVLLTCVAFLLWYAALSRLGAERAGLFAGLIPVTAALSGALLGTGALHAGELSGAVLVGLGVCLGLSLPQRHAEPTRHTDPMHHADLTDNQDASLVAQ